MPANVRAMVAVGVILAGALCLGCFGFHAARAAEASRMALAKKRAALTVEMRELAAIIAARKLPPLESGTASGESPWRMKTGEPGVSSGPPGSATIASNPNMAALSLALFRANLARKYRQFYRTLALSPQQISAFENLQTAYQEETIDLNAVASADGLDSQPEIDAIRRQEDDNFWTAQLALLGDAGYQQLQEYNRALPVWNMVNDIGSFDFAFTPEPLSASQKQQLATVLMGASGSYENGGPATLDSIDWNAALAQAPGFLSAAQMEELKSAMNRIELLQLGRQFFQHEPGLK